MINTDKRILCSIIMMAFLFSMFCVGISDAKYEQENQSVLSYPGLLYLEYVKSINGGTGLEQETGRQLLQMRRKVSQRLNPFRILMPDLGSINPEKTNTPRTLGLLCTMVFLTIIIYIYRTDGKKRVLL